MTPTPQTRAVKVLRILEASFAGCTVAELARAVDAGVSVVAKDLAGIRAADEPLEATGPLADPHTVVRLAR